MNAPWNRKIKLDLHRQSSKDKYLRTQVTLLSSLGRRLQPPAMGAALQSTVHGSRAPWDCACGGEGNGCASQPCGAAAPHTSAQRPAAVGTHRLAHEQQGLAPVCFRATGKLIVEETCFSQYL